MTITNEDKKIEEFIQIVKKQRQEVIDSEQIINKAWITNCSVYPPFKQESSSCINIQTASLSVIVDLVVSLLAYQEFKAQAHKALELSIDNDNIFHGFPIQDWIEDCKKRINIIQIKDKKVKLNNVEERLNKLISPEMKRKMELDDIKKELQL